VTVEVLDSTDVFPTAKRRRWSTAIWPAAAVGCVSLVLLVYVALMAGNLAYLGLDDLAVFLGTKRLWVRVWLTVWTATVSTLLSLVVGIPAGYALSRLRLPWPKLTATLIDLPVMMPPAAAGWFLFGVATSFPMKHICDLLGLKFAHNPNGIVLVQFVVTVAFCTRLMKAGFDAVNPRFEQVSRSLGASLPTTLRRVTLPLAKNAILASTVIVWARAAAEWEGLMIFVGGTMGKTDVLPFSVYLDWNGALYGPVVTYSLVSVALAVASMGAVRLIGGKKYVW